MKKIIPSFLAGIILTCAVQYFCYPVSVWWSREIHDCVIRIPADATGAEITHLQIGGSHEYGVCSD